MAANQKLVDYTSSDESMAAINEYIDHFTKLFRSKKDTDVKIIVEGKEILAHKIVLKRCDYFKRMFGNEVFEEARNNEAHWRDIDFDIAYKVIEYIYSTEVFISSESEALKLLRVAEMIMDARLKRKCQNFLIRCIDIENAVKLIHWAYKYSAEKLKDAATNFITKNCEEVIRSEGWKIFKNDNPIPAAIYEALVKEVSPSKRLRISDD